MWWNLANYLPCQGIDAIYDQNTLLKEYPQSAKHMTDWGLPDGYTFQYAKKLLKEATEPLFVTILTVTNHPPYVTPSFYQPKPITVTPAVEEKAGAGQIDIKKILTTYQYAKDALGKFISNIKNSELVNNTIISATGDHTLRRIKAVMPNDLVIDKPFPSTFMSQNPFWSRSIISTTRNKSDRIKIFYRPCTTSAYLWRIITILAGETCW